MYQLQNKLEHNHDAAANKNTAITDVFQTPDGVNVQIFAETKNIVDKKYPRFRIVKVADSAIENTN